MDQPRCKTCPYWDDTEPWEHDDGSLINECRRFPRHWQINSERYFGVDSAWPRTHEDDWCGEHPDFPEYLASLKKPSGA